MNYWGVHFWVLSLSDGLCRFLRKRTTESLSFRRRPLPGGFAYTALVIFHSKSVIDCHIRLGPFARLREQINKREREQKKARAVRDVLSRTASDCQPFLSCSGEFSISARSLISFRSQPVKPFQCWAPKRRPQHSKLFFRPRHSQALAPSSHDGSTIRLGNDRALRLPGPVTFSVPPRRELASSRSSRKELNGCVS